MQLNSTRAPKNPSSVELAYKKFKARTDVGFTRLPYDTEAINESIKLGEQIRNQFDQLIIVGMGGSSMGPRCLHEISEGLHYKKNSTVGSVDRLFFLDNVDSVETEKVLTKIKDLRKTAWLFISKSGSTIEVLWTFDLIIQLYQEKNIEIWPRTFYITEDTSNPLNNLALLHKRPRLKIPLDVGGRFSVLSPVGLVVSEYLNFDTRLLIAGGKEVLEQASSEAQVIQCVDEYLQSFKRQEAITLFWFYNSNMRWFGCWLQQLWAESLGKKSNIHNQAAPPFSSPMICIGACDQHSILQQIMDGPRDKFVNFFRFKNVEECSFKVSSTHFEETKILEGLNFGQLIKAEAIGTEKALQNAGVSTLSFTLNNLDEKNIGFLFMFFQMIIATLGEHEEIDAFNQPGVALSKKMTLEVLQKNKS